MTIRGACDAAYTLLIERHEARATALWAAVTAAGGEAPHPEMALQHIDELVTKAAPDLDPAEAELRRLLGVL